MYKIDQSIDKSTETTDYIERPEIEVELWSAI